MCVCTRGREGRLLSLPSRLPLEVDAEANHRDLTTGRVRVWGIGGGGVRRCWKGFTDDYISESVMLEFVSPTDFFFIFSLCLLGKCKEDLQYFSFFVRLTVLFKLKKENAG